MDLGEGQLLVSTSVQRNASSDESTAFDADIAGKWEMVYADVESKRESWSADVSDEDTWYALQLMGGKWRVERTGRSVYGPRVSIRPDTLAYTFARHFNMPESASFENNKFGEGVTHTLVLLWKHRMSALA
eukprot:517939-Amphidinium_carterae.1